MGSRAREEDGSILPPMPIGQFRRAPSWEEAHHGEAAQEEMKIRRRTPSSLLVASCPNRITTDHWYCSCRDMYVAYLITEKDWILVYTSHPPRCPPQLLRIL
ncbi:hypothetical protein ACQJBY_006018 [Aegilops geniculata]